MNSTFAARLRRIAAAVTIAVITASASTAQASVIKWILDAPLRDTGNVTGSFLFDTTTNSLSQIALVSSASGRLFDVYLGEFLVTGPNLAFGQSGADLTAPTRVGLMLYPIPITALDTPGVLTLNPETTTAFIAEYSCPIALCLTNASVLSSWKPGGFGTLTGRPYTPPPIIPLPAAGWLLLTALCGLGLYGRRRRQAG
jgi:hypothetical protein